MIYDSMASQSTQSEVYSDINTVLHAFDSTATCCCTKQPRPGMQLKWGVSFILLFCGSAITMQVDRVE